MTEKEEPKKPYENLEQVLSILSTAYGVRGADPEDHNTLDSTLQLWKILRPSEPLNEDKLRNVWGLKRATEALTEDAFSETIQYFTDPEHQREGIEYITKKVKEDDVFFDAVVGSYRHKGLEKILTDPKTKPETKKKKLEQISEVDRDLYTYAKISKIQKAIKSGKIKEEAYIAVALQDLSERSLFDQSACLKDYSHFIRTTKDAEEYLGDRLAFLKAKISTEFKKTIPAGKKGKTKEVLDRNTLAAYIEKAIETEYEDKEKPLEYVKMASYGVGLNIEAEEAKYQKRKIDGGYSPAPQINTQ